MYQSTNQAGLLHCIQPCHTYTVNLTNKNKKVTHEHLYVIQTVQQGVAKER